eukprot:SAG22_NODE_56_length_23716_cov_11.146759_15_plen_243_part_00
MLVGLVGGGGLVGAMGGHYFAYLRGAGGQWLRFNDAMVTALTAEEAERAFADVEPPPAEIPKAPPLPGSSSEAPNPEDGGAEAAGGSEQSGAATAIQAAFRKKKNTPAPAAGGLAQAVPVAAKFGYLLIYTRDDGLPSADGSGGGSGSSCAEAAAAQPPPDLAAAVAEDNAAFAAAKLVWQEEQKWLKVPVELPPAANAAGPAWVSTTVRVLKSRPCGEVLQDSAVVAAAAGESRHVLAATL